MGIYAGSNVGVYRRPMDDWQWIKMQFRIALNKVRGKTCWIRYCLYVSVFCGTLWICKNLELNVNFFKHIPAEKNIFPASIYFFGENGGSVTWLQNTVFFLFRLLHFSSWKVNWHRLKRKAERFENPLYIGSASGGRIKNHHTPHFTRN